MAQEFNRAVLTNKGAALLVAAQAGEARIEFTYMKIGNGVYTETEKETANLKEAVGLKSLKNEFEFSEKMIYSQNALKLSAFLTNYGIDGQAVVTEGYYINEIGLFAKNALQEDAEEILYTISVVSAEQGDFMPPYSGSNPVQIMQEYYVTVDAVENVLIKISGQYASFESVEDLRKTVNSIKQSVDVIQKNVTTMRNDMLPLALTQADYDALDEATQKNGRLYVIVG